MDMQTWMHINLFITHSTIKYSHSGLYIMLLWPPISAPRSTGCKFMAFVRKFVHYKQQTPCRLSVTAVLIILKFI
jgi:hypothetical protein